MILEACGGPNEAGVVQDCIPSWKLADNVQSRTGWKARENATRDRRYSASSGLDGSAEIILELLGVDTVGLEQLGENGLCIGRITVSHARRVRVAVSIWIIVSVRPTTSYGDRLDSARCRDGTE